MSDEIRFYTQPNMIKKLYRLAYIFHDIMIKHDILYYASSGTLLGAMRHHGIIPWDNDLDFAIPLLDKSKFLSKDVKKSFEKHGYRIAKSINGWYRVYDITEKDASADVFFTKLVKNKKGEWIIQHTGNALKIWPNEYMPYKDLFPLKERQFGSGFILTPNKPQKALSEFYGKSWKKVGYITMNPETHLDLDEPIKLKVKKFRPAMSFHNRAQIHLSQDDPYLHGIIW